MKKLYIAYLPKKAKESLSDRKILKILKWYSQVTKYTNSIISSPGYMSKTIISIDHYLSLFATHVNSNSSSCSNNIYYGILNGMNGNNIIKNQGVKILDYHNNRMNKYNFTPIKMKVKPVLDHRKVMCFFKHTDTNRIDELYNELDIKKFLNNVTVKAVLIGSSNQSDSTYFDNISN